jgi:hypothetical protein
MENLHMALSWGVTVACILDMFITFRMDLEFKYKMARMIAFLCLLCAITGFLAGSMWGLMWIFLWLLWRSNARMSKIRWIKEEEKFGNDE